MADGHIRLDDIRRVGAPHIHLPSGVYGIDFGVSRRGDGRWQVSQNTYFIDREGEKDVYTDVVSTWPKEIQARAQLAAIQARGA